MQSLGNFNGLTASSLLLCESEVVEKIYKLTTKHTDEYMASGLVEELFYLKYILTEEHHKKIVKSLMKDKSGANKGMQYLLRGIGEILFLRNLLNKEQSSEHFSDDEASLFDDLSVPEINSEASELENDLFAETDLFGSATHSAGSDGDLFGDMGFGQSSTGNSDDALVGTIIGNTAAELIEIGRKGFNITTGLVYELEEDWIEFKNFSSFFNARFKKVASKAITQSVKDGDVSIKPAVCESKPRFKYSIEDSHLSLYQLSLEELNYIDSLQDEVESLEIDESDVEIEGDLAYEIYKKIYDRANSIYEPTNELLIDRYIRIFREKASTLGGTKITLLQTPINRLQQAFSNYNTITKAKSLMHIVNKEVGDAQIDVIADMLNDLTQAKEYIGMFKEEVSESRSDIETDITKYLVNLMNDRGAPKEINPDVRDLINLLLRNKLIKPKVVNISSVLPNIYNLYKLYSLAPKFSLEAIDESLSFDDFVELNRKLVKEYDLIPLSVSDIYIDAIIQNYKVKQNGTKEFYFAIAPNLDLIERNLQSRQIILVNTSKASITPESMPYMNEDYKIFLTVGTGGNN